MSEAEAENVSVCVAHARVVETLIPWQGNVVIDLSEFHEDPQVVHNKLLVTNDYPSGVGAIREPRPAPLMSSTPLRVGGEAPARGQDTRSVLSKAGFTEDEIAALQQSGAFGDRVP